MKSIIVPRDSRVKDAAVLICCCLESTKEFGYVKRTARCGEGERVCVCVSVLKIVVKLLEMGLDSVKQLSR